MRHEISLSSYCFGIAFHLNHENVVDELTGGSLEGGGCGEGAGQSLVAHIARPAHEHPQAQQPLTLHQLRTQTQIHIRVFQP